MVEEEEGEGMEGERREEEEGWVSPRGDRRRGMEGTEHRLRVREEGCRRSRAVPGEGVTALLLKRVEGATAPHQEGTVRLPLRRRRATGCLLSNSSR